ncbi:Transcription elongation factor SPT5 [Hypsibius exemplaris]|uniref:Transcription elongation factor SPT5 n=1 Tax=Hypsibius exemplaris TaxID=2072580 RepID=A0A1W0X817_HYPEX|nr:Transcription elongation factor SPT5 [Hypsibius exemplaris]
MSDSEESDGDFQPRKKIKKDPGEGGAVKDDDKDDDMDHEDGDEEEDDDEEEEDDEEDEEEKEENEEDYSDIALKPTSKKEPKRRKNAKPVKKKSRHHNDFILDEAEVDDDEEEDELEGEEGFDEIIATKDRHHHGGPGEDGPSARDLESKRRLDNMYNKDAKDIEEYYRNKYAETSARDRALSDSQTSEDITKQSLLPNVKDPNLWLVRCRQGEEKATVLQLQRKYLALLNSAEPLQIKSVLAVDGLKGHVYVEAFKKTHVTQAIEGISNLRMGLMNQQMVPIKEMTDVLKVVRTTGAIRAKQWVRIRTGINKDDLGQVEWVDYSQNTATVRLIPRIDYNLIKERATAKRNAGDGKTVPKPRTGLRPPQRLFEPEQIRECGADYRRDGDMYVYGSSRYTLRGFLIKTFPLKSILVEGVKPSLAELEKFDDSVDGMDLSQVVADVANTDENQDANRFSHGDFVEVCEGELIHLKGKVIRVAGNKVVIQPEHEELKEPIEFPVRELKKFFRTGDHVRVLRGRYGGETGLVVRVEDNLVVLFADLTMHEMKVLPEDVQISSERASGIDSLGQYSWGELVELSNNTVAVIVRIERDSFQVLDTQGRVTTVKASAILRKKDSSRAQASDHKENSIRAKESVKVLDGPHAGRTGEIKHVFRYTVFLHSKLYPENGGMFVCPAKAVLLAGASTAGNGGPSNSNPSYSFAPASPHVAASPMHPSSFGGGGPGLNSTPKPGSRTPGGQTPSSLGRPAMAASRGRRDNTFIGKTVKITQGPYKGHLGIVKDATDMLVRVELHSKPQTISVDRSRIAEIGSTSTATINARPPMSRGDSESQRPVRSDERVWPQRQPGAGGSSHDPSPRTDFGTRTPRYEDTRYGDSARTPRYEDPTKTPMYEAGSRTPHYGASGSRTPAHGGGSRTPRYEAGNKTPAYAMATPSHNAWDSEPAEEDEEERGWDDARSRNAPREQEPDDIEGFSGSVMPPATPGNFGGDSAYNPKTPGFPGSGAVDSPAPSYSPQTPGGSGFDSDSFGGANSPYSPAPNARHTMNPPDTPSNYFMQSPGVGFSGSGIAPSPYSGAPQTPGYESSSLYPQTPGGVMDGQRDGDWVTTDIQVKIRRHEDLQGSIGHVRSVTGMMCSIYIPDKDKVINILSSWLEPVRPTRGDQVKILAGENREMCGKMLSVTGSNAVVKADNADAVKVVPWNDLCRLAPSSRL